MHFLEKHYRNESSLHHLMEFVRSIVFWLLLLTKIILLRWFLLAVSAVFPFFLNKYQGKILWSYANNLFLYTILHTNFSIHQWLFFAAIINGVFAWWFFISSLFHLLFTWLYQYGLIDFYFILWVVLHFVAQIIPSLAIRSFLRLVPVFFW